MSDIQALFTKLTVSYRKAVPEKLSSLRELIGEAVRSTTAVSRLAQEAHQVAGSAGTFSLPELGLFARTLMEDARQVRDADRLLSIDERDAMLALVDEMETSTLRSLR